MQITFFKIHFVKTLFCIKYFTFGTKIQHEMRFVLFNILLLISGFISAQGLQIDVKLDMAAGKEVKLAHHYLGNIYLDDSVKLDANGRGVFMRDSLLHQGLYKMYLDENNHFDFLLGADQQFSVSNPTFGAESVEIKGATETEEFFKYIHFLDKLRKESAEIKEKMNSAAADEKEKLQAELKALNPKVQQYWFQKKEEYPNSFLAEFLLANYVPELEISSLPEEIQKNDSILLLKRFYYQRQHYWDYFDYTDERMLYTPFYKPKLETWFTKVLFQTYDSVRVPVFNFIEDVRPEKRIFQFVCSWFLNSSINSNIMGMDALFVDLARAYYLSGEAFWTSEESMKVIRENVIFLEQNLIGEKAPDLNLESVDGEYIDLYKINAKATVLLIFEPNCSHCKEFVPKFHEEVYQKYKDKGVVVYCIYSMDNKEEWTDFLTKHNLYDWINVWDPENLSNFKVTYDARKTPGIYVLDENKIIFAKKLTVEQLDNVLGRMIEEKVSVQ